MKDSAKQISILDFLDDKDWIDKYYFVWMTYHRGEWTEYSPKFLDKEAAKSWHMDKGEDLVYRFGRKLKLFQIKPTDYNEVFYVQYELNGDPVVKAIPGEDLHDAIDNLILFEPNAKNISLGFKN